MYQLLWSVPYEGDAYEWVNSLQEAKTWLENNASRYEFDVGNVTISKIEKDISPYDVMNGVIVD